MRHRLGKKILAVDCETAIELLLKDLGGSYRLGSIMEWCEGYGLHPGKSFLQHLLFDMEGRGLIRNVSPHNNYLWEWVAQTGTPDMGSGAGAQHRLEDA